jgi:hypothetical protein
VNLKQGLGFFLTLSRSVSFKLEKETRKWVNPQEILNSKVIENGKLKNTLLKIFGV